MTKIDDEYKKKDCLSAAKITSNNLKLVRQKENMETANA